MAPIHIVTVIAVIACDNKFLLVKRHPNDAIFPGKWQNPGGKVEEEEIIEHALLREVKEETGIILTTEPMYLQSYSFRMVHNEPNRLGLIFLFQLDGSPQNHSISLSDELSDYGWFPSDEIKKLDAVGTTTARAGTYGQILQAEKYLSTFPKD